VILDWKVPMLRRIALVIFVIAGVVSTLPIAARQQTPDALTAALARLDLDLAADFARDGVAGASVGVVSGSRLIWTRHYGFADVEARRPPTNDTDYRIGSITKQFTALMLLQLVEQGTVRLSDPIETYVPEVKSLQHQFAGSPPITLVQVATMMSGLAREPAVPAAEFMDGPVRHWDTKVVELLPRASYEYEPGTQYLYSNFGYAVLGVALERAAGQPYTEYVAQHIFRPLGMTRSAFEPTPGVRTDLAHGYARQDGKPDRTGPDQELDGRGYKVPNGAIFSTINDLATFVAWELGEGPDAVLSKATQDANYRRVYSATDTRATLTMTSGYGIGFQATRRGDLVLLGHGGSTGGYHASVLFHRPSHLGVIVLRNCDFCGFDAGPVSVRVLETLASAK
jgi:CubicO group peptidase (beta-lactamase class C family)